MQVVNTHTQKASKSNANINRNLLQACNAVHGGERQPWEHGVLLYLWCSPVWEKLHSPMRKAALAGGETQMPGKSV